MIRDVNDKLNNIKRAIHEFSAETSLWVEELLHAQGSGIEGVEMVAGSLSNITTASKRHLQTAIREDYNGFLQDLDNIQGPMRVQTEGPEDRKRQKTSTNSEDDSQASSPGQWAQSFADLPCQDARYSELPPDSTSYRPSPAPPRTAPPASILQARVEEEQRRSMEESQHQDDMDIDDEDIRLQHQWAMKQQPTIGRRWSNQCDHPWATLTRPQGCYLCGEQHDRKSCGWRNIFEDPPGEPLLGDLLLGKGYEYDPKGGRERKGSIVPEG